MIRFSRTLIFALVLAGDLSACGSKDKAAAQSTETSATVSETPAVAPAASKLVAVADTAKVATFDINTMPVTSAELGSFPYLSPLKGYSVNTPNSEDLTLSAPTCTTAKIWCPLRARFPNVSST